MTSEAATIDRPAPATPVPPAGKACFPPSEADVIRQADRLLSPEAFRECLREGGFARYHIHHPFHRLMNSGDLTLGQMQAWALNRYCYQATIPKKDALILARSEDPEFRREWRKRIVDHDGGDGSEIDGGIRRWIRLADGLGLDREIVTAKRHALPATRFAVGAYLDLVTRGSMITAVASSLTELFSPIAIGERVPAMLARYDYITEDTLAYFTPRLKQAPRDADFALDWVTAHADTPGKQADALKALLSKCDILWAMLDALHFAYVEPGRIAPGAFIPDDHPETPGA